MKHVRGLAAISLIAASVVGTISTPVFADIEYDLVDFVLPVHIPVGWSETFSFRDPKHENDLGFGIVANSDDDAIELIGTTLDGYQLTAKNAGNFTIGVEFDEEHGGGGKGTTGWVYALETNHPEIINDTLLNYLINYGEFWYWNDTVDNGALPAFIDAVEAGETISANLIITGLEVDNVGEEEKAKIAEIVGEDEVIAYSDIDLTISGSTSGLIDNITNLMACGAVAGSEPEQQAGVCPEQTITIRWGNLDLGEPEEGYERVFYVVRVHDGEAKRLEVEVDGDDGVVFESSKFSTYAVAYRDILADDDEPNTGENEDPAVPNTSNDEKAPDTGANTKTSENIIISLVGCMMAGVAGALALMPAIRKHLTTKKN